MLRGMVFGNTEQSLVVEDVIKRLDGMKIYTTSVILSKDYSIETFKEIASQMDSNDFIVILLNEKCKYTNIPTRTIPVELSAFNSAAITKNKVIYYIVPEDVPNWKI